MLTRACDHPEFQSFLQGLKSGALPDERGWGLKTSKGHGLAQIAADHDLLPDDFSGWRLVDGYGLPVSHIAAERGTLPSDFKDWEIRDSIGRTVAHVIAWNRSLPPDFNLWTLRDNCGFNVAETACEHGHLPPGISDWRDLIRIAGTPENLIPNPSYLQSRIQNHYLSKLDSQRVPTFRKISERIMSDDFTNLLGNYLDSFYLYINSEVRKNMLRDAPEDMPEAWHVPFLASTAAVLARRFDLEVPAWTFEKRCYLPAEAPYCSGLPKIGKRPKAPLDTPPEFKERNVFVSSNTLYRV
ncbi:MAG: hypothetical protein LBQ79_10490 [Deltaproteobacteria bacterium]|jgi:hypothetical protein|nr:hypothetical protein [Deltaproteobacteria bacterium]